MADDITYSGSGASVPTNTKQVTDEHATRGHMPVIKIAYSADGDATLVGADSNGLDVDVTRLNDGGNSITVDAPVGTPVFVRLSDGSSAIATLPVSLASVPSHAVTNAGTFAVQVDGSALTSLQLIDDPVLADDAAFTPATSKVMMAGAEFDDSSPDSVDEGDAGALRMSARRELYTQIRDAAGNERGANVNSSNQLSVSVDNSVTVSSHAVTNAGVFAVQATVAAGATNIAKAEDVASADADVGVPAMAVRKATPANTSGTDGDYEFLQMSAGRLWASATIDAALPAGTNAIGKLSSNTGVTIGAVELASSQTLATVTTVSTVTGGGIAHDGADSGNPLKIGGRAVNAEITAVSNNDRSDFLTDLVGKQIVLPYANPENFLNGTTAAITDTTSTQVIAAQAAGVRIYVTSILVSNSHATVGTFVKILDGASIIYEGYAAAGGGGFAVALPVPLRGSTATALNAQAVTTGANFIVSCAGYKGV